MKPTTISLIFMISLTVTLAVILYFLIGVIK